MCHILTFSKGWYVQQLLRININIYPLVLLLQKSLIYSCASFTFNCIAFFVCVCVWNSRFFVAPGALLFEFNPSPPLTTAVNRHHCHHRLKTLSRWSNQVKWKKELERLTLNSWIHPFACAALISIHFMILQCTTIYLYNYCKFWYWLYKIITWQVMKWNNSKKLFHFIVFLSEYSRVGILLSPI